MKELIIDYGWTVWLGFSLVVIGLSPFNWETYFVIIPTVVLVEIYRFYTLRRRNERNS